ncbi:MAG TPA: T9SS type A sorting domain-containing protein [Ignavibacteria bacterium]
MKKFLFFSIPIVLFLVGFAFITIDGPNDSVSPNDKATNTMEQYYKTGTSNPGTIIDNPEAVLYDRSQCISHPGAGFGGADASAIELPGTTYGPNMGAIYPYRIADKFEVPAGKTWTIDSVLVYGYQTGSTTTSTMTSVTLRIWKGIGPDTTGAIVAFGDTTTNRMASTRFTNIYRVTSTTLTNNQRPIMVENVTVGTTLTEGTYWVDYNMGGTIASGPWCVPRTILGTLVTGEARQRVTNSPIVWNAIQDPAPNYKGATFKMYGTENNVTPPTWTEQTSPIATALTCVSAVNDNVAWACGNGGKVLRTINAGVNWTDVSGTISTTYDLENIFAWDANTALTTGYSTTTGITTIYQTSNGGTNWTLANSHAGFGDDLWMTSATDAYFIGDPISGFWDLLKSTNGGSNWATWASIATTNTVGTYMNAACFLDQQVWYPSPAQSTMQYTSNMGVNWSILTTPLASVTATYFINSTTGLCGGYSSSPGLIRTTNGGTNWTTVAQSFIGASTVMGLTGRGSEWWVATESTTPSAIYYTSNDGATWASQYPAPAGIFYHISKARTGNTLWAVRSNGGIARYGTPLVGITPITENTPVDYQLSQNYPNPFNPTTKISFALPKSGFVSLKVYDILGKEVTTLVNSNMSVGSYSFEFNASNLTSGIYFYRLESNGFIDTKKMMLIK